MTEEPIEIFCCYADADEAWLRKLETHLQLLQRQGLISFWHNRLITPGTDRAHTIDTHIEAANLILLLLSPDFLISPFYCGSMLTKVLERHPNEEPKIIPILLRPVDVRGTPLSTLQALPKNGVPISLWPNQDQVWMDVVRDIRTVIEERRPSIAGSKLSSPGTSGSKPIWHVAYRRNPFFTGRDHLLTRLRERLTTTNAAALTQPQAISGLGGIGKTQTALEYAYRYRKEYRAVLWVSAASRETLLAELVVLARILSLPILQDQEQAMVVTEVKRWLTDHEEWLLILDNADELEVVSDLLLEGAGHILLTTRAHSPGILAHRVEVETMSLQEGMALVLRRAGILEPGTSIAQASEEQRTQAAAIVGAMDGLPLALDQAGAYIEETGCSPSDYLTLYQKRTATLLSRRGRWSPPYPHTVATTWALSFEQVERKSPAAADLLRLCAFLDPDAIPEELLTEGVAELGSALGSTATDPFKLNEALTVLLSYSLIRRTPETRTLTIHRLVQVVLQDALKDQQRRLWAGRVVLAVNAAFPHAEHGREPQCERLLSQALSTTQVIEHYQIKSSEAGRLLHETASYLRERGRYASAKPLFLQAMRIWEQQFGIEHPSVANSLTGLANIYRSQGRYVEAEAFFLRALHIGEKQLGSEHLSVGDTLYGLANLYREQGKFVQAETLFLRALHIWEQYLGLEHPSVANALSGLATLYYHHGKYAKAESLYQRSLAIGEQQFGPEHLSLTYRLNGLAGISRLRGEYAQAEALYQRILRIWERQSGLEHPNLAHPLNGLAALYREQGKYTEAELLYQRALRIRESQLGPEHPYLAYSLSGLAALYHEQGKDTQAEPLYQRALHIWEQVQLPEHPAIADIMDDFAQLREAQGQIDEARTWYARVLAVREQTFGAHHLKTVETRQHLITLLHVLARHEEAAQLEAFNPNHEENAQDNNF